MIFYSPQPSCARRIQRKANADTFNFTPQIASAICVIAFTKRVKPDTTIFGSRCSRTVIGYRLDRGHALLLVRTRFLRLANGSPELVRSPTRWSRNVRDATGKTSGEMSRVTVAQCPRNRQAAADAMSPDDRRDDLQDSLRHADVGRAASALETCETVRNLSAQRTRSSRAAVHAMVNATSHKQLAGFSPSAFNRHVQKL